MSGNSESSQNLLHLSRGMTFCFFFFIFFLRFILEATRFFHRAGQLVRLHFSPKTGSGRGDKTPRVCYNRGAPLFFLILPLNLGA